MGMTDETMDRLKKLAEAGYTADEVVGGILDVISKHNKEVEERTGLKLYEAMYHYTKWPLERLLIERERKVQDKQVLEEELDAIEKNIGWARKEMEAKDEKIDRGKEETDL